MITDQFLNNIEDINQSFSGWDFSFISGTGRVQEELLTWSYGSIARPLIQRAKSMLDMGTGGGEFLSLLRPFPETVFATEGYKPNVPIAKKRLEPLGVNVVHFEKDSNLPLQDGQFDLILNKHDSYSSAELRRIISDSGIFLTQQVGGLNCSQINETMEVPLNEEFHNWNLKTALEELNECNFNVLYSKEEFPVQRFYDVGALVYYLKAIPWQVPNFNIEDYLDELYQVYQIIQSKGYFDVHQHRFIIQAEAV
ncbi:methyltransferase domain-containing protein [Tuberibacillus sp. Marseille-P3662]|uniref:methyltransferase domain-containing protein n=1 Tax=Tuberibacillus sp. Marseille-P3662 TaxID=1965358 RepID=UPI000A1CDB39|nr:methyltransferase domain-containing protein [Tuberibacillus sp. Marseille-P3662]